MEFDIWAVLSAVLGVAAIVGAGFYAKAKGKIKAVANLIKESYETVDKVFDILEDNKVTKEEVEELKKEAQDVRDAFKVLIGKGA